MSLITSTLLRALAQLHLASFPLMAPLSHDRRCPSRLTLAAECTLPRGLELGRAYPHVHVYCSRETNPTWRHFQPGALEGNTEGECDVVALPRRWQLVSWAIVVGKSVVILSESKEDNFFPQ